MSLSLPQVRQIAELARLHLTDDELTTLTPQLEAIVSYVELLQQLDTDAIEPMAHALPVSNVFRDDTPGVSLPTDAALANAPQTRQQAGSRFYAVPAVME